MAPMDQLRRTALEALSRRHDYIDETTLRRRDHGDGGGGGRRGNGNGYRDDGNGNGREDDGEENNDDGNNNNKNSGQRRPGPPAAANQVASPSPSSILPPLSLFPTSSIPATIPTSPTLFRTTIPTTIPTTTSNTPISTLFPITSTPSFSSPPESTTQPRHGVDSSEFPDSEQTVTSTTTSSMFITPESAIVSSSTSLPPSTPFQQDKDFFHHNKNKHNGGELTPLAQHLLIAAGAIGAFIIVISVIYFLTRMRKIDILASIRSRKFGKGGSRGWYGWRKKTPYYMDEPPPTYSGDVYPPEKNISTQQTVEPSYVPTIIPASAIKPLPRPDPGRQEMVREASLNSHTPFTTSPATQHMAPSATANFYGAAAPHPSSLSRQPGTQNSQGTFISQLDPNTATQNTYLTMNTMRSMQTQDVYDPNQREPNHLSYLSSLSSGFGDGLIIPESTVVGGGRQSYRQSKAPGAGRFSWMTSERGSRAPGQSDRDTVYTQASVESVPRFRSVNSWVAQQAGRVERRLEIPAMPALPVPLQAGVTPVNGHQRNFSEDPAFRHHPGDEIEISRGVRVPSAILDRKTGVK